MGSIIANIIIIALIVTVLCCLFKALYILVRKKGEKKGDGVANFLTLRVTFSGILIAFLVLANHMGWIHFHGPHQDPRIVHQMALQQQMLEQKAKEKSTEP